MTASVWNPGQYERFRDERSQPFFDLMALVRPRPRMRIVDLGCGTGELTGHLHAHLQARETLGLDSSPTMLARGQAAAGNGLHFELGDIAAFAPAQPYDLVFSNASLQWLPDHETLFARLTTAVAADGQFAAQMPANDDHPSHMTAAEIARESPFREALGGFERRMALLPVEDYARLLYRLGYREQHVRLQVYGHLLGAREDVIEWVKGTLLTDYQRRLPSDLYDAFLARYRERLLPRLEAAQPYFYSFKRLLIWGQR